ncbi:MAG: hypothetical protein GY787_06460 [Alteromonadales bacterium]|nr:hypothetical protein [Alteromonadales bacterium]
MEKIFKAKRLDNGEWHVFKLIDIEWSDDDSFRVKVFRKLPSGSKSESFVFVYKKTICQYTGISDSEGNRIFEGDEVYVAGVGNVIVSVDVNGVHCGDEPYICCYGDIEHLTGHNIHDRG